MAPGFNGREGAQSDQARHSPDSETVLHSSAATANRRHAPCSARRRRLLEESLRARIATASGLAGLRNQHAGVCAGGDDRRRPVVAGSPSDSQNARPVSLVWVRPTPRLLDRLSGMWLATSTSNAGVIDRAAAALWISCRYIGGLYGMRRGAEGDPVSVGIRWHGRLGRAVVTSRTGETLVPLEQFQ